MKSVVRPWLSETCTFKQQTVLLSALRGGDGIPKEDRSKKFTRKLRNTLLYAADQASPTTPGTFMYNVVTGEEIVEFCNLLDHYPMHWLMHFIHAVEIVGYKHPKKEERAWWIWFYYQLCEGLHMHSESEAEVDQRLKDNDPEI